MERTLFMYSATLRGSLAVKLPSKNRRDRAGTIASIHREIEAYQNTPETTHPPLLFYCLGQEPFLVIPWYDSTLSSKDNKNARPTCKEIRSWMAALLNQLKSLHEAGWVHRDVKPSNVLLQGSKLSLADFGHAYSSNWQSRVHLTGTHPYNHPTFYFGRSFKVGKNLPSRTELTSKKKSWSSWWFICLLLDLVAPLAHLSPWIHKCLFRKSWFCENWCTQTWQTSRSDWLARVSVQPFELADR